MRFRQTRRWTVAALAAATSISAIARAEEPSVLLKPKFVPGRTTYLELVMDTASTITGGARGEQGMQSSLRQVEGVWQKIESSSLTEGTCISLTYDRFATSVKSPMQSLSYDSDSGEAAGPSQLFAAIFDPMLGMPLTMKLDTDGHITSFTGMEAIAEKVSAAAAGSPLLPGMKGNLTDEMAEWRWGKSRFVLYPNKEVRVGDKWSHTVQQPSPATGDWLLQYDCHLKEIGNEDGRLVAIVGYTGTIGLVPGAAPTASFGGTVALKSGSFEGTATFDVERGEFTKRVEEFRIVLEMATPASHGNNPKSAKMDQHTSQTFTVMTEAEREKQKAENQRKQATPESQPAP